MPARSAHRLTFCGAKGWPRTRALLEHCLQLARKRAVAVNPTREFYAARTGGPREIAGIADCRRKVPLVRPGAWKNSISGEFPGCFDIDPQCLDNAVRPPEAERSIFP